MSRDGPTTTVSCRLSSAFGQHTVKRSRQIKRDRSRDSDKARTRRDVVLFCSVSGRGASWLDTAVVGRSSEVGRVHVLAALLARVKETLLLPFLLLLPGASRRYDQARRRPGLLWLRYVGTYAHALAARERMSLPSYSSKREWRRANGAQLSQGCQSDDDCASNKTLRCRTRATKTGRLRWFLTASPGRAGVSKVGIARRQTAAGQRVRERESFDRSKRSRWDDGEGGGGDGGGGVFYSIILSDCLDGERPDASRGEEEKNGRVGRGSKMDGWGPSRR